ncbi:hypothetical protein KRMM14A1004_36960 [Krasilnikovia sp. MM14-A1004]
MTFDAAAVAPPLLVEVQASTAAGTVMTVVGDIDMVSEADLHTAVTAVLSHDKPHRLVLDMGGVTFLDSSGVRALIQCRDRADRIGTRLEIRSAHEIVRQVLTVCGIADLVHLS